MYVCVYIYIYIHTSKHSKSTFKHMSRFVSLDKTACNTLHVIISIINQLRNLTD